MKKIISLSLLIIALISMPVLAADITFEGSSIGAGTSQRAGGLHIVNFVIEPISVTPVSAAKIMMQGSPDNSGADDGAITTPGIAIGSTAEKFANALFYYRINAVNYSKAANAAGTAFAAAHKIAASKYGAIRIGINRFGSIGTQIPGVNQGATLSYDTALEAIAAIEASAIVTGFIQVGMIVIQNNGSLWTANTDDLTDASDITKAAFYSTTSSFTEIDEYTLTADDITAQKGTFYLSRDLPEAYIRIFLSSITGEGNFVITDVQNQ